MKRTKAQQESQRNTYTALMVLTGIFSLGLIPLSQWLMKRMIQNAIEDAGLKK